MTTFTLAHLTDPHLAPLPAPRWHELIGKRMTGYLNWRRKRGALHQPTILDALVADLKAQAPDHVALTGDLVNIGLTAEFGPARAWLERLGPADRITVVPGNHDVYVRATADNYATAWEPYLWDGGRPPTEPFPALRRRGPIALISVSSAVPTPPFMATGTLGEHQRHRLAALLERLAAEPVFRVVLVHHPLTMPPADWYKRLIDGPDLTAIIARHGAELVLHGHDHRDSTVWIDGPGRPVPVVGAPSASAADDGRHDPAAYHLFRVESTGSAWRCEMITRGLTQDSSPQIAELRRTALY
jgi:3',5'-cyclic AMP phosphodiesterase CpdA